MKYKKKLRPLHLILWATVFTTAHSNYYFPKLLWRNSFEMDETLFKCMKKCLKGWIFTDCIHKPMTVGEINVVGLAIVELTYVVFKNLSNLMIMFYFLHFFFLFIYLSAQFQKSTRLKFNLFLILFPGTDNWILFFNSLQLIRAH